MNALEYSYVQHNISPSDSVRNTNLHLPLTQYYITLKGLCMFFFFNDIQAFILVKGVSACPCFHHSQSELVLVNTLDHCGVMWPGNAPIPPDDTHASGCTDQLKRSTRKLVQRKLKLKLSDNEYKDRLNTQLHWEWRYCVQTIPGKKHLKPHLVQHPSSLNIVNADEGFLQMEDAALWGPGGGGGG